MGYEVFDALEREWRYLVRRPATAAGVARWAEDPILGGLRDLDDVLRRTARGADRSEADRVLLALASRAADDELAARALLQALLPGLGGLARRHRAGPGNDVAAEVVGLAYERIRTYPAEQRPGAVAANVVLDVHSVLWRTRIDPCPATVPLDERTAGAIEIEIADPDPAGEVQRIVWAAVTERRLSEPDARLLLRVHAAGAPMAQVARAEGVPLRTIYKRRQRAERRLTRACGELKVS